ncbi:MAG: PaaI family thioesterase [Dehalococcoidia bacterium]
MRKLPDSVKHSPFAGVLGLKFARIEDGYTQAKALITDRLRNNYGTVHGGAIYTMADVCMGAAVFFSLDEDEMCVTAEMKISYLKPAHSGELQCEARLDQRTGNVATAESEIINNENLIARAIGTFYIQQMPVQSAQTKEES